MREVIDFFGGSFPAVLDWRRRCEQGGGEGDGEERSRFQSIVDKVLSARHGHSRSLRGKRRIKSVNVKLFKCRAAYW